MRKKMSSSALIVAFALLVSANSDASGASKLPSPHEIIASAGEDEWVSIDPDDLVVLRIKRQGTEVEHRIVMQLMPRALNSAWGDNVRALVRAGWWTSAAITRVQDNYVVQWGAVEGSPPRPKLRPTSAADYEVAEPTSGVVRLLSSGRDAYAGWSGFWKGWPVAGERRAEISRMWPVHCYAMVGVGRDITPDSGDGSELYAVIGHAPRHLDRNIALVGRIVQGIEHLSSLPRGTGGMGFYENVRERVPIISVEFASSLAVKERIHLQYLNTQSVSFAKLIQARANRQDDFFAKPAGGVDVCNASIPIRERKGDYACWARKL